MHPEVNRVLIPVPNLFSFAEKRQVMTSPNDKERLNAPDWMVFQICLPGYQFRIVMLLASGPADQRLVYQIFCGRILS
jgi:hypothetical protein